jgi:hypothetical protein
MIHDIHIIHHTHTDLGYTDAPATAARLHQEALAEAIGLALADDRDDEGAFRWACEVFEPVEALLAARPELATPLEALVRSGRIEVCALPFNLTPLIGAAGWRQMQVRLGRLARFQPRVAMNNDVNGMPWGVLPGLRGAGVNWVWMGMNTYSGCTPLPRPGVFRWEGPDGQRTPVWNGLPYSEAYGFFHRDEWRRGPLPAAHDVWYHRPEEGDLWAAGPAALEGAAQQLQERLAGLSDYPYPVLALQFTNRWRIDNDPPFAPLSSFVRAWNASGRLPRLTLSTPSRFLTALEPHLGADLPVLRGDWCDAWADGVASTPVELVLQRRAKRVLEALPLAAPLLSSGYDALELERAWAVASRFDEHTWGAYESVARPWCARSLANQIGKTALATEADEAAACLRAAVVRSSPAYCPAARTRALAVINPTSTGRWGWVDIPAQALRWPAAAVCAGVGQTLPLETVSGAEWLPAGAPGLGLDDLPDDVWPTVPWRRRFRCRLGPGEVRRFEFQAECAFAPARPAPLAGQSAAWEWEWDARAGRLLHLVPGGGANLIDRVVPWRFGGLLVEQATGVGARAGLATRDPATLAALVREQPAAESVVALPSPWGARFRCAYRHPAFRRIVQVWDLFDDGELELTTILHPLLTEVPQVWYLAFPLDLPGATASYEAVGVETRVGQDQMPGSCGEVVVSDGRVSFQDRQRVLDIDADDTPVGVFGGPWVRSGRSVGPLARPAWFAVLHHTYWATNFAVTRCGRLEVRQRLRVRPAHESAVAPGEFWSFPAP